MRGYLSLFLGSLIVIIMLVAPGNTTQAATQTGPPAETATEDHCGCDVTPILGAERNKVVSKLLKNEEFKLLKMDLKKDGYTWEGAHGIEVIRNNTYGNIILVGVPFLNEDGTEEFFGFALIDGAFIKF